MSEGEEVEAGGNEGESLAREILRESERRGGEETGREGRGRQERVMVS